MANTNPVKRMKELIALIKEADTAYFKNDSPKLSDREYDMLVNELKDLEASSGIVFADSPSKRVSGETKKTLTTVLHTKPMLSANKTKSVAEVANFIGTQEALLSWKLDGLTLVLRYKNGILEKAITRGNGSEGEDVTHTVKYFRNVPSKIPYRDYLEVRGEGVLSWADFEMLGKSMASGESHPRNLAAGIVRTSNADRGKCSHLDFIAFAIISDTEYTKKIDQLAFLSGLGFDVVPHKFVPCVRNQEEFQEVVDSFVPDAYGYPVDGLVAEYNDIEFGKSLGATAHHENKLIALKWQDELTETIFRGVELITTRTGTVSIVGLFDTVVIDGARIHRASLHNLSVFEKYKFGIGDKISVYKANMIIPQIAENKTQSGTFVLPKFCPCCGETLTVKYSMSGVKDLYCPNTECIARNAQKIARFCDKKAMNIEGLSAVTLEKLMAFGWIKNFYDLYHLDEHRESIANTPGFGISSFEKMWNAINASRKTSLGKFLLGVGIVIGIDSGYRSLAHQQKIYSDFIIKYGKEYADKIVAPVGCSEHHTGLAIDISIKVDNKFLIDNNDLMKNENIYLEIHKYLSNFGFILRYPKGKDEITGYPYEPWHIRYVGGSVAKKIYDDDLTLEEYLLLYKQIFLY